MARTTTETARSTRIFRNSTPRVLTATLAYAPEPERSSAISEERERFAALQHRDRCRGRKPATASTTIATAPLTKATQAAVRYATRAKLANARSAPSHAKPAR